MILRANCKYRKARVRNWQKVQCARHHSWEQIHCDSEAKILVEAQAPNQGGPFAVDSVNSPHKCIPHRDCLGIGRPKPMCGVLPVGRDLGHLVPSLPPLPSLHPPFISAAKLPETYDAPLGRDFFPPANQQTAFSLSPSPLSEMRIRRQTTWRFPPPPTRRGRRGIE